MAWYIDRLEIWITLIPLYILLQILVHFIWFISFPLLIISQNTKQPKNRETNFPKNAKQTNTTISSAFLRSVSGCNQPTNQPTSLELRRRLSSGWRPPQLEATNCRTRNLKRPNLMTSNGGSAPGRFGEWKTPGGCWVGGCLGEGLTKKSELLKLSWRVQLKLKKNSKF